MTPCDFCIEEECGGGDRKGSCDCSTCDKRDLCPKVLRPTIRITTRCTQACSHCCFTCSPKRNEMMSVEMSRTIAQFLKANGIDTLNLMGGEIFCNPDWAEIVDILCEGCLHVRIVTNGDWVGTDFLDRLEAHREILKIAISRDEWHTNTNIDAAAAECEAKGFNYKVTEDGEMTTDSIVPAGRGDLYYGVYSSFGTYCTKPDRKYTFLIDEAGEIYKCGFGAWGYANVSEHLEGDFGARFKFFNQKFYKCFISNCAGCQRAYRRALHENRAT